MPKLNLEPEPRVEADSTAILQQQYSAELVSAFSVNSVPAEFDTEHEDTDECEGEDIDDGSIELRADINENSSNGSRFFSLETSPRVVSSPYADAKAQLVSPISPAGDTNATVPPVEEVGSIATAPPAIPLPLPISAPSASPTPVFAPLVPEVTDLPAAWPDSVDLASSDTSGTAEYSNNLLQTFTQLTEEFAGRRRQFTSSPTPFSESLQSYKVCEVALDAAKLKAVALRQEVDGKIQKVCVLKTGVVRQHQPAKQKADIVMAETKFRHAEFSPERELELRQCMDNYRAFCETELTKKEYERNMSRFRTEQMIAAATNDYGADKISNARHYLDVIFYTLKSLDEEIGSGASVDAKSSEWKITLRGVLQSWIAILGGYILHNSPMHADKAFLLIHVCHAIAGLDSTVDRTWLLSLIQIAPSPKSPFSGRRAQIDIFLAAMHVLLAPMPATNAIHAAWSEDDAVAIFEQLPHPQMFTLMFQHGRAEDGIKLVSWASVEDVFSSARLAVRTCGLAMCGLSHHHRFALLLSRTITCVLDRAAKFVAATVDYVGEQRLRPLFDALFEDSMMYLLRCDLPNVEISIADFPFFCLSGPASWKALLRIYLGCTSEAEKLYSSCSATVNSLDAWMSLILSNRMVRMTSKSSLMRATSKMEDGPSDTATFRLMSMGSLGVDRGGDVARVTITELLQLGYIDSSTKERYRKLAEENISRICTCHTDLISFVLTRVQRTLARSGAALPLFRLLPVDLWIPKSSEVLQVLGHWLSAARHDDVSCALAMEIIQGMNWGLDIKGALFLPPIVHRLLACAVGLASVNVNPYHSDLVDWRHFGNGCLLLEHLILRIFALGAGNRCCVFTSLVRLAFPWSPYGVCTTVSLGLVRTLVTSRTTEMNWLPEYRARLARWQKVPMQRRRLTTPYLDSSSSILLIIAALAVGILLSAS